ncbi:CoA transferase [Cryptosporangium sp. NPDC048952]|uniref:CaiB/BaiF CoA-transferase family protein n=1 Tax=Cryptosporangium sp. NPDC048952 TaxID=3363961 RepID=UPI003710BC80
MTLSRPLHGITVVDLSSGIPGAYCTKLLVDAGATVVKLEAPEGDPLRSWSASGASGRDLPLFRFLSGGKQSVVVDPGAVAAARAVLSRADAVVWSPESRLAAVLSPSWLTGEFPHLVVTAVTPFGLSGPWAGRPATDFTLQAWSGGIVGIGRGRPDRAPVQIGGRAGEWVSGAYAAVGLLVGLLARRGGLVDVSRLEVAALTMTYYPVTFFDVNSEPYRAERIVRAPGVWSAKDGLIGLACGTLQQRTDFYAMVGQPSWTDDDALLARPEDVVPVVAEWIAVRTVAEIRELASAFRIPNAPIGTGATIPTWDQITHRHSVVPSSDGTFLQPAAPFRLSAAPLREPSPAPQLGEHTAAWTAPPEPPLSAAPPRSAPVAAGGARAAASAAAEAPDVLPLEGLRVLDLTAYWAGPLSTHTLALLGAEVVHVESTTRPDGGRLVVAAEPTVEAWWERSPIHLGGNAGKKDVTIDLATDEGRELLLGLIPTCDVIVENYTPRVFEQLGLTYDRLRTIKPDLVMLRMPGFGLDGPWRENTAFAYAIEDASGLTWLTGYPDENPVEPNCFGDPNAGIHAVFALLVALEHRTRTGQGSLVEAAMIDAALNVAAEQVIEHSAHGVLLNRAGNRSPAAAPQNLYHASGTDEFGRDDVWVALSVTSDEQWAALCEVTNVPLADRHEDELLRQWFRERTADEAVDLLWTAGVPIARVVLPHRQPELEQFRARHFHEQVDHPIVGRYRQSTLPFRWPGAPERLTPRHAPLLGEHNAEILGLPPAELARLTATGVIGTAPAGQN